MTKKKLTFQQLMTAAVILAVFIISFVYASQRNFRKGIFVGDQFFYVKSQTLLEAGNKDQISLKSSDSGIDFTITQGGTTQSAHLQSDGEQVNITYENGPVINGEWTGKRIVDSGGGMPLESSVDKIRTDDGNVSQSKASYSDLSNALYLISQNKLTLRNSILNMLLGIVFYFVGATEFLFPETYHFFLRGWRYKHQELSEEGTFTEKVGGVVVMLLGMVTFTGIFS